MKSVGFHKVRKINKTCSCRRKYKVQSKRAASSWGELYRFSVTFITSRTDFYKCMVVIENPNTSVSHFLTNVLQVRVAIRNAIHKLFWRL